MTAKESITSWWILALMSLFLWYRNEKYDRALSIFIFTLGLIQLIEYGIYSGTDPNQSGRALFITLWLQCLILAIGVFLFINASIDPNNPTLTQNIVHTIAGWNLFLFAIIFVITLLLSFTSNNTFSGHQAPSGQIELYMNNRSLLGQWGWLYLIGLFFPLLLIFGFYMWADIGTAILIIYGILSVVYIFTNQEFHSTCTNNIWGYLSVGFAFLVWVLGIIPSHSSVHIESEITKLPV